MNNTKDELTILIPTHNRHNKLKRLLNYYDFKKIEFKIIVLDSSEQRLDDNYFNNLKVKNFIKYMYFNNLETISGEGANTLKFKINKGLELVNTKYVIINADDDFIIVENLNECISFLDNNTDYSVVHGKYIAFYLSNDVDNTRKFMWNKNKYLSTSNNFDDPIERLLNYIEGKTSPIYFGIYKTEVQKRIFHEILKTTDTRFGELLGGSLALMFGKEMKLNIFYYAREKALTKDYVKDYNSFIQEDTLTQKFNDYKEIVLKYCKILDIKYNNHLSMNIYKSFNIYLNNIN